MIFRPVFSFVWEAIFVKVASYPLKLSYRTHPLELCFKPSYTMIRQESDEHVSDCGLLSVSCPIAQGTILWCSSIFANLTHTEMQL